MKIGANIEQLTDASLSFPRDTQIARTIILYIDAFLKPCVWTEEFAEEHDCAVASNTSFSDSITAVKNSILQAPLIQQLQHACQASSIDNMVEEVLAVAKRRPGQPKKKKKAF